ncbi:MAG: hypothetical protein GY789_27360 [Hyphomicrobiales bacterium]|nr:hypothetical protein [Hyphomicrobiales bacterium]MCP4999342.1 hypothetical protein [Hyphomicrobiales bacterium]
MLPIGKQVSAPARQALEKGFDDQGWPGEHGVGRTPMSQLIANLATLRIDRIRTELDWNHVELLSFLNVAGFAPAQRVVLRRSLSA